MFGLRRGIVAAVLALSFPAVGALAAAPQSALLGNWNAERLNPGSDSPTPATLSFTRNASGIVGTMRSGSDALGLFDVHEDGPIVSFTLVIPGTPYATVHYKGTVAGNTLRLVSANEGDGVYRLTAQRNGPPPPQAADDAAPAPAPSAKAATPARQPAPQTDRATAAPRLRNAVPAQAAPPVAQTQTAGAQGVPDYLLRLLNEQPVTGSPPSKESLPAAMRSPALAATPAPANNQTEPPAPAQIRTASVEPPPQRSAAAAQTKPAPAARASKPAAPAPVPVVHAASIEGNWTALVTPPGGVPTAVSLSFAHKDDALTGVMHQGTGDLPLLEVRQTGVSVSFMLVIPGTPYMPVRYAGRISDDIMQLSSIDEGSGRYTMTANRLPGAATLAETRPVELRPTIADAEPAATAPVKAETAPAQAPALAVPQVRTASVQSATAAPGPKYTAPPPAFAEFTGSIQLPPPPAEVTGSIQPPPPLAPDLPSETKPEAAPVLPASQSPRPQPTRPTQAGLDGRWTAQQSSAGSAAPVTASLAFAGNSGSMHVGQDEWPLFDVKQTRTDVAFTLVIPGKPYVTIHYRGMLDGDQLQAESIDENQSRFMLQAQREGSEAKPEPILAALSPRTAPQQAALPREPVSAPAPAVAASVSPPPPLPLALPKEPSPASALPAPLGTAGPDIEPGKLPLPPLHDVGPVGVLKTPPMGWASRGRLGTVIDDAAIRQAADGLEETGLKAVGYTYVEADDGWQGVRDAAGVLHPNDKFPDMKALAGYVHSKGLKFALRTSAAPKSCAGFTGSYGHEAEDAKNFAAWGVDILVYDWCGAEKIYPTQAEMQAAYQKMGDALKATGRNIAFDISADGQFGVGAWGSKTGANIWRTGKDVEDKWQSIVDAALAENGTETAAGPNHWNDPGLLQIGNGGMTPDEYRSHFNIWAVLAAPLMLGNDVRIMRRETVDALINKEVIAVDQDPLGRQAKLAARQGNAEVWAKPLADGSVAVLFVNHGDTSAPATVSWDQLGIAGPVQVRDLWWHETIGHANDRYAAFLTAHTSLLLKFSR